MTSTFKITHQMLESDDFNKIIAAEWQRRRMQKWRWLKSAPGMLSGMLTLLSVLNLNAPVVFTSGHVVENTVWLMAASITTLHDALLRLLRFCGPTDFDQPRPLSLAYAI